MPIDPLAALSGPGAAAVSMSIWLLLLLAAGICFLVYFSIRQNQLTVSRYTLPTKKLRRPVRVVLLSDLHEKLFGSGNHRLLSEIRRQKPDLVLVAGDMVDAPGSEGLVPLELMGALSQEYPVYYSLGNHELRTRGKSSYLKKLNASGISLLDNEMVYLTVNAQQLLIGGMTCEPDEAPDLSDPFFQLFEASSACKLLLCHYPHLFKDCLRYRDIDLILAGHAHGGQVRIPLLHQGLFAPQQGLFPRYTAGLHQYRSCAMVVSRGLGNPSTIPRMFNPPEIVVIDLTPDAGQGRRCEASRR